MSPHTRLPCVRSIQRCNKKRGSLPRFFIALAEQGDPVRVMRALIQLYTGFFDCSTPATQLGLQIRAERGRV